MQSQLSRGMTARIVSGFHCICFTTGKILFEEGVFTSFPRGTCSASANAERWLCSRESQMDLIEGMKMGEPLSSSFLIRSSTRSLRSESHPAVFPPRRKGSMIRLSSSEKGNREDVDELSQNVMFAQAYYE